MTEQTQSLLAIGGGVVLIVLGVLLPTSKLWEAFARLTTSVRGSRDDESAGEVFRFVARALGVIGALWLVVGVVMLVRGWV